MPRKKHSTKCIIIPKLAKGQTIEDIQQELEDMMVEFFEFSQDTLQKRYKKHYLDQVMHTRTNKKENSAKAEIIFVISNKYIVENPSMFSPRISKEEVEKNLIPHLNKNDSFDLCFTLTIQNLGADGFKINLLAFYEIVREKLTISELKKKVSNAKEVDTFLKRVAKTDWGNNLLKKTSSKKNKYLH